MESEGGFGEWGDLEVRAGDVTRVVRGRAGALAALTN